MHTAVMIVMWSVIYLVFASSLSIVLGKTLRRSRATPDDDPLTASTVASSSTVASVELTTH